MSIVLSRYPSSAVYTYQRDDGTLITVNGRRFMLASTSNNYLQVTQSSRIDTVAYNTYGDATRYWAITDQLVTLDPFDTFSDKNVGTLIQLPTLQEINDYESQS